MITFVFIVVKTKFDTKTFKAVLSLAFRDFIRYLMPLLFLTFILEGNSIKSSMKNNIERFLKVFKIK